VRGDAWKCEQSLELDMYFQSHELILMPVVLAQNHGTGINREGSSNAALLVLK